MTDLRAAAQQALEALEESRDAVWHDYATDWRHRMPTRKAQLDAKRDGAEAHDAAIAALKAALAEQAQPVQEPVAWLAYTEDGKSAYVTDNPTDLIGAYRALPLYTAPPAAQPVQLEKAESISDALMNLVDRLGSEADQVDPRAWRHLLVYAPKPEPVQEPVAWTWADDFREWVVQSAKVSGSLSINDILSMFDVCRPDVNRLSIPKEEAEVWQGGMTNEELRREWAQRLPGVEPTDRELSAFAVGIEAGYKIVWVDDPLVIALREKLKRIRKAAVNLIETVEDNNSLWWVAADDLKKLLGKSDE